MMTAGVRVKRMSAQRVQYECCMRGITNVWYVLSVNVKDGKERKWEREREFAEIYNWRTSLFS